MELSHKNMAERGIYELKIDTGFKRLIPPLSAEELEQLEQNIIRDGCREPICVWNDTILDGHNRYEICTRLQIPFMIQIMHFENREEAVAWICANQLGRRNITEETRKYLIGKRYEMEKMLGAHNAVGINQHTQKEVRYKIYTEPPFDGTTCRTRERLGEEYRISEGTVYKYSQYANALDSLSQITPELVPRILSGEVKISHENTVELSRLSGKDIKCLSRMAPENDTEFAEILRKVLPKKQVATEKLHFSVPAGSVKDMPAYDPDAEISSLTFTIPSWVTSISRTSSATNFNAVTDNARSNLVKQLLELKIAVDSMLAVIKEDI